MTLTITKGMYGRKVELIGEYSVKDTEDNEVNKMFKDFYAWKNKNSTREKYHVASYERQIINDNKHVIVIDFGDYTYFGCIKASKKEWKTLENCRLRPVDLEV